MDNTSHSSLKTILQDRSLWFDGDVTLSEDQLIQFLSAGTSPARVFVDKITSTVEQYNRLVPLNQQLTVKTSVNTQWNYEWILPPEFASIDIDRHVRALLVDECSKFGDADAKIRVVRTLTELAAFKQANLHGLLRVLNYVINTLTKNNVPWGVGRGSSVASYVLFLMGVHDVDSVLYDLNFNQFMKD